MGDKRIGVALSDPEGILASPLTIIEREDDAGTIEAIIEIVKQKEVGKIIVGLPKSMDGSIGVQAEKVIGFVHKLREHTEIPIEFRDERLTSVSARRLIQADGNRKTKKKVRDDALAAAFILQGYLEEGRAPLDLE